MNQMHGNICEKVTEWIKNKEYKTGTLMQFLDLNLVQVPMYGELLAIIEDNLFIMQELPILI